MSTNVGQEPDTDEDGDEAMRLIAAPMIVVELPEGAIGIVFDPDTEAGRKAAADLGVVGFVPRDVRRLSSDLAALLRRRA